MNIVSAGATDPGKKRGNNEDAFLVHDAFGLFAVADGVGGSEGGEVASWTAVETLASAFPDVLAGKDRILPKGFSPESNGEFLAFRSAVQLANSSIIEERSRRPELADMGTTLTALLLKEGRACLIHVGDSRAYLFRFGALRQISIDHKIVSEYVRAGLLTPGEARTSPYRHVITRALGIGENVVPDVTVHAVLQGDVFLLCTDGLTNMVPDNEIANVLSMHAPREAVQELIDAANRGGGVDNITAVVVKVQEI